MNTMLLAIVGAALMTLTHLFSGKLRFLEGTPRSRWLSFAGGISVAYVFVNLLPELAESQETLRQYAQETVFRFAERHVYLIALFGLATFYGVDRMARRAAPRSDDDREDETPASIFWTHIASFAVYNVLIGYLLVRRETPGLTRLALFIVAMTLHFVVNDYGLREQHKKSFERKGRWVLAAAIWGGLALGSLTEVHRVVLAVLLGFLAGGVVLNVLKEELPRERRSRFWAFAVGAAGYAALLLFTV